MPIYGIPMHQIDHVRKSYNHNDSRNHQDDCYDCWLSLLSHPCTSSTTSTPRGQLGSCSLASPRSTPRGQLGSCSLASPRNDDPEAQIIVSCCTNIIVICPPLSIPPHQQRLGGRYHHPWLKPCPSLPPDTFIALMPLSEEDMAIIIQGKIARSSQT
jgi:hypothetical protein